MHAAIYARLSSDRDGDGAGIARQLEDCRQLAHLRGFQVVAEHSDNDTSASGRVQRPGFEAVLAAVERREVQVVLAWNLDRISRNRRDTLRLIETCQAHSTTIALVRGADLDMSTPGGRLMADLFGAIAKNESDVKSDRQKRANRQRAEAGQPHRARRAYGYEPNGIDIREDEAEVLRWMADVFLRGWSLRDIVSQLHERGALSTTGREFSLKAVRDHLSSKRVAGIRHYEGRDYNAVWPAIFTRETHTRILAELARRAPSAATRPISRKYLLTGLARCGRCEQLMVGHARKDPGKELARPKYECPSYPGVDSCGRNTRLAVPLEHLISEAVLYRLDSPELAQLLAARGTSEGDADALAAQVDAYIEQLGLLLDDYSDGTLSKGEFTRARSRVRERLAIAEAELQEQLTREHGHSLLSADVPLRTAWSANGLGWRQRLLALLIEDVVVMPSRKKPIYQADSETYRFDVDAIDVRWRV